MTKKTITKTPQPSVTTQAPECGGCTESVNPADNGVALFRVRPKGGLWLCPGCAAKACAALGITQ